MDEINQIQNPNVPSTSSPMSQMPMKKKNIWLWIVAVIAIAAAGLSWWYIDQMAVEPIVEEPQIDQEAREDMRISNEVEGVDLGDMDMEFEQVDEDLNSL